MSDKNDIEDLVIWRLGDVVIWNVHAQLSRLSCGEAQGQGGAGVVVDRFDAEQAQEERGDDDLDAGDQQGGAEQGEFGGGRSSWPGS